MIHTRVDQNHLIFYDVSQAMKRGKDGKDGDNPKSPFSQFLRRHFDL